MRTFGSVLASRQGFGAGFDFIRIALAMSILAYHSVVVVGGSHDFMAGPTWIVPNSLVPMFFGVSGFLVAGSALRLKLKDFLINRGLRIFPALAMDIALSAVILGAIFTTLPLSTYYSSPDFWQYFGSIVGAIQYDLPGVFLTNESAGVVNQSLWTVPYEFLCYFVMSLLMLTRLLHRPRLLLILGIAFLLTPVAIQLAVPDYMSLPKAITSLFFGRGSGAFQCFVAGILIYLYRDRIPFRIEIAAVAVAAVLCVAVVGNASWAQTGGLNLALTPALTYFILYVGLSPIPEVPFYSRGDYSYGVYLYGYPIQQAVYASIEDKTVWWLNFVLSVLIVTAIAVFSWHMIEKPVLKLRKKFSFVGRRIADADGNKLAVTPSSPEAVTPGG